MVSKPNRRSLTIDLQTPIVFVILAATAIPIGLRSPSLTSIDFGIDVLDVIENIVGYVPLGVALSRFGSLPAFVTAAGISLFAETLQLFMLFREPSAIDLAMNSIGAGVGILIGLRTRNHLRSWPISRGRAWLAATLALGLVLQVWLDAGSLRSPLNARGATERGALEADWKLDEQGDVARDSSGHGIEGRLRHGPRRVAGPRGGAIQLSDARQYLDFGRSIAFRLVGSMTISAWFKAAHFPGDDAALVSTLSADSGFQLDTTADRGSRTIGFKLTSGCGKLMARYGTTALRSGAWYHAAGVYNAEGRTLDVYLNGKLDDGSLIGPVTSRQRSARDALYVGRRPDRHGYAFAGELDEVRLYSFALTGDEVVSDMRGQAIDARPWPTAPRKRAPQASDADLSCPSSAESDDARVPATAAAFGLLFAIACLGVWPSAGTLRCALLSFAAGTLLMLAMSSTASTPSRRLMPVLSLLGSIAATTSSTRRAADTAP